MRFRNFFLCFGKMAYCQRAFAFSSLSRASTQRLPDGVSSFFQKGASVYSQSMMYSHASNASPRCADVTRQSTI